MEESGQHRDDGQKPIDWWLWQSPISVLVAMISLNTTPAIAHKQVGPEFDATNLIHKAVFFAGFAVAFFGIMISLVKAKWPSP